MSYPAMLNLEGRPVLVVGGGRVARRKVEALLEAGAQVRLVSPQAGPDLAGWAQEGRIDWYPREYEPIDLEGCWLVLAATDNAEVNSRIAGDAERAGIWSNIADRPELCGFTVPASLRRGALTMAVSTGGASPLLAARIRDDLARQYGPEWAAYGRLLAAVRARILSVGKGSEENRVVFKAALEADLLTPLKSGDQEELEARLKVATGLSLKDLEAVDK
jgi:precorrin-2 dehydrogenase / sirohydrochlorin ferrochelatase